MKSRKSMQLQKVTRRDVGTVNKESRVQCLKRANNCIRIDNVVRVIYMQSDERGLYKSQNTTSCVW